MPCIKCLCNAWMTKAMPATLFVETLGHNTLKLGTLPIRRKIVETMIGCIGSVGRELYPQPILPAKCASQLRSRERAASITNRGLSLIDLRSASDGTTSKLNGFRESRALHN
jgi:hypothetical protein